MSSQKSLRELMAEFEAIVAWFDNDDLDVEAATQKFAAGAKLAEQIKQQLTAAKNKITLIKEKFDVTTDAANASDAPDETDETDSSMTARKTTAKNITSEETVAGAE